MKEVDDAVTGADEDGVDGVQYADRKFHVA
jgi:hypothetical protein